MNREIVVLLVLISTVVVGLIFHGRRARRHGAVDRAPAVRHPLVRIVCATLAGGILLAVAIGSWNAAHEPYRAVDAGAALTVKVPAHPWSPGRFALDALPGQWQPAANARFLIRVFIGSMTPAGFCARQVREWDVRWPLTSGEEFSGSWSGEGLQVDYTISIREMMDARLTDGEGKSRQTLVAHSDFRCQSRSRMASGSSGGSMFLSEAGHVVDLDQGIGGSGGPLSITTPSSGTIAMFAALTPLAADETLVEQPAAAFIAAYQERLATSQLSDRLDRRSRDLNDIAMRGLALAAHIGLSSLVLLATALLLVQCFRQRQLALAGALFGVVLFVAILDRVVVGVHLAQLEDPKASVERRLLAGSCLSDSFFHRATAVRHLRAVADDQQAPADLRAALGKIAQSLAQNPL